MPVQNPPEGYQNVIPYYMAQDCGRFMDFLKEALDATQIGDVAQSPDGAIMHAEMRVGDSVLMMGQASNEFPKRPMTLLVYVDDVDAMFQKAVAAGCKSTQEPADQFYGDRSGNVEDPFGNWWFLSTHIEDVPPEEMERRHKEYVEKMAATA